jgi:hypothetical protein
MRLFNKIAFFSNRPSDLLTEGKKSARRMRNLRRRSQSVQSVLFRQLDAAFRSHFIDDKPNRFNDFFIGMGLAINDRFVLGFLGAPNRSMLADLMRASPQGSLSADSGVPFDALPRSRREPSTDRAGAIEAPCESRLREVRSARIRIGSSKPSYECCIVKKLGNREP